MVFGADSAAPAAPFRLQTEWCDARDSQAAGRQPGRDRHPGLPLGPRAGHPDGGHLLARRPVRDAPAQGRRGLPGRQAGRADPELSEHRGDRRAGAGEGGRRDPPRLRLPLRERRRSPAPATPPGSPSSARGPSCSTCSATRSPPARLARGGGRAGPRRAATSRSSPAPRRTSSPRRSAIR